MENSPEPTPHWGDSVRRWGALWDIHINVIGALFIAIAFWNAISLLLHVLERKATSRRIFKCYSTINFLLLFFNFIRGLSLLVNPYNSNVHHLKLSQGISFLFWGMTVPCFTASFMLMNMALLDATKMQLYSKKLQNMKLILCIVSFNFVLVISVDVTSILRPSLYFILYVCQVFFMLFGVAVAGTMIFTGYSVLNKVRESERQLRSFNNNVIVNKTAELGHDINLQSPSTSGNIRQDKDAKIDVPGRQALTKISAEPMPKQKSSNETSWKSKKFRRSTKRFTMISIIISVAAILYSLIQIYSFIAIYDFNDPSKPINPWHWIAYQTTARLLEVTMSICVSFVVRSKRNILPCHNPHQT
ncbi:uncharacterized protein LOC135693420 [Rhopilema esculentum]|uniref:uncharacterized protein LOC135693420 n=1 Tax=Rhopilema esculentum TaxID=499914 RepID=UPI0031E21321|eukprot:gene10833-19649_t